jgi:deoxyribodipyrimidine photolyase-like uncharacterized protein
MNKIIWLPADQLNVNHKIFSEVADYDQVLFIWDDAIFKRHFFSKQRLYFVWQCLQDFNQQKLMVIKGGTADVLKALSSKNPAVKIFTPKSHYLTELENVNSVIEIDQPDFIVYDQHIPFGFFKFWKKAEKQLFG